MSKSLKREELEARLQECKTKQELEDVLFRYTDGNYNLMVNENDNYYYAHKFIIFKNNPKIYESIIKTNVKYEEDKKNKRKIGDLTLNEMTIICKKQEIDGCHYCNSCPLVDVCNEPLNTIDCELDQEVEVEE